MLFTMSVNFRVICYEWQGLTASVLPDRRRRRPTTATATGNGDADGKVNDKSTLSQAVQGADTKRRAMKKRTRTRARGQGLDNWDSSRGGGGEPGGRRALNKHCSNLDSCPRRVGKAIQLHKTNLK